MLPQREPVKRQKTELQVGRHADAKKPGRDAAAEPQRDGRANFPRSLRTLHFDCVGHAGPGNIPGSNPDQQGKCPECQTGPDLEH